MKKAVLILLSCFTLWITAPAAMAAMQLPNYAQGGNLTTETQSKGKKVTDFIVMVVAILSIISLAIGAGGFGTGNADAGKRFVVGGVLGLVFGGAIYGIAALVA